MPILFVSLKNGNHELAQLGVVELTLRQISQLETHRRDGKVGRLFERVVLLHEQTASLVKILRCRCRVFVNPSFLIQQAFLLQGQISAILPITLH